MSGDTNVVTVSASYLKELEAYKEAYIKLTGSTIVFPTFTHVMTTPECGDWYGVDWSKKEIEK